MMRRALSAFSAVLLLTLPAIAIAVDCHLLTVDQAPNDAATDTLTFDVAGSSPLSLQVLVVGDTLGETILSTPKASLTLGLEFPFYIMPLGFSDLSGNLSVSFDAPVGLGTFHAQNTGVQFDPDLAFCTSNLVSFTL